MVTLITEQLRKQSLEEPYYKAFSINHLQHIDVVVENLSRVCLAVFLENSSNPHQSLKANPLDVSCGQDSLWPPSHSGDPIERPEIPFIDKAYQSSPPPPPPKRHCRSLSVPEDLSRCRSTWHPTASKVWTPVKRDSHSGGASSSSSAAGSLPFCGPGSSFASSSLHSSSSPTFFSLALTSDSPLPWSFQWEPSPLLQRRFSLSPVHIQHASVALLSPRPSPAAALTSCSTPSSSRRDLHPALPRCHSQPCDMRKPRLKRRHDPDVQPCPRPGLDFSKMTQVSTKVQSNHESSACGGTVPDSSQPDQSSALSPTDFLERASIGPLSESEEEEEEEDKRQRTMIDRGQKFVFERDCAELDLNLIEDN
uniref:Uncharacterized protein n=1 Tax=Mola mola TaxID=94237 RepID=A0A3Q3W9C5_MOLML